MGAITTIAVDYVIKTFQLSDGSVINCHLYDTAGQERYRSLGLLYYQRADAVLLVYDISVRKSFEQIKNYFINEIKDKCKKNVIVLLLGNKADKEDQREVTLQEGVDLALKEKYEFKESSCLHNQNVAGAFEYLLERWNYLKHQTPDDNKMKRYNTDFSKDKKNKEKKEKLEKNMRKSKMSTNMEIEDNKPKNIILTKEANKKDSKKGCC
jgi:small GTP-binding protein